MRLTTWLKARFTQPFHSFAPNAHQLYILRHCINIVFALQKSRSKNFDFELLIKLSLDCPFGYLLSTGSELDSQL